MVSNFNSGQAIKTFVVGPVNFSDGPKEMNKKSTYVQVYLVWNLCSKSRWMKING